MAAKKKFLATITAERTDSGNVSGGTKVNFELSDAEKDAAFIQVIRGVVTLADCWNINHRLREVVTKLGKELAAKQKAVR